MRFAGGTRFACRLVGANAEPLRAVKTTIQAPNAQAVQAPEPEPPLQDHQKLATRAEEIPAPAPPEHPEHLGANLGRTMALF